MLLGQTDSLATKPNKTDLRPVASCGVVTAIKTKSKANIWSPEMQGKTPFLLGGSNIRKQRKRGLAWRNSLRARRKGFVQYPWGLSRVPIRMSSMPIPRALDDRFDICELRIPMEFSF